MTKTIFDIFAIVKKEIDSILNEFKKNNEEDFDVDTWDCLNSFKILTEFKVFVHEEYVYYSERFNATNIHEDEFIKTEKLELNFVFKEFLKKWASEDYSENLIQYLKDILGLKGIK